MTKLIAILLVLLGATLVVEQYRVAAQRTRAAGLALAAANVAAERDSTREIAVANRSVAALLGDSLRAIEEQVAQVTQQRDALDVALGRERRARYALSASVAPVQQTLMAPVSADTADATRRARFDLRSPPYTVVADVEIPPRPDTARLALRVALDTIPLTARLTCSRPSGDGIRTASLVATSPPWATVRLGRLEQSPDLCASPALARAAPRRLVALSPLVVGVGRLYGLGSQGTWGVFVGTGLAVGR